MKKIVIVFLVLSFSFYFLLLGIFSDHGFIHNMSLRDMLSQLEKTAQQMNIELETLKNKDSDLSTEEGLRDVAIALGYYVEGDSVYMFSSSSVQEGHTFTKEAETKIEIFKGLKNYVCLLIGVSISALISLIIALTENKKETHDFKQKESTDNSDSYFINA